MKVVNAKLGQHRIHETQQRFAHSFSAPQEILFTNFTLRYFIYVNKGSFILS